MLGFGRITFDSNIMGGRACIRGMHITVSPVVNLVASGMSVAEILQAYPYLEAEEVNECPRYAETVYPAAPAAVS